MDITSEYLQQRHAELDAQADRLRAQLNATLGAIQNTDALIARLNVEPPPASAPPRPTGRAPRRRR